jgi:hypothetical protein
VPGRFAPFSRNDTHGAKVLANETMVAFTVKLGIGQDAGNGREVPRLFEQGRKEGFVVGGARPSHLGQNQLAGQIRDDDPLDESAAR